MLWPWQDRSGAVSPLKAATFALLFLPALWVVWHYWSGQLGARPLNEGIHEIGRWSLRLLLVALLITPAIRMTGWRRLIIGRRMIGVAAFVYAVIHLLLYVWQEQFNLIKVASEIVLRVYLVIGFVALVAMMALAVTSTDAMIRRLGRNWQRLHWLAYPIAILGVVHQFMQSKAGVDEAMVMAGLLGWLLVYRLAGRAFGSDRKMPMAVILALLAAAGPLTALAEALYYYLKMGVKMERVLRANLMPLANLRPGWAVLICALVLVLLAVVAALLRRRYAGLPSGRTRTA
jgi:sulfoxide reductase heme-binding subunit YedZ